MRYINVVMLWDSSLSSIWWYPHLRSNLLIRTHSLWLLAYPPGLHQLWELDTFHEWWPCWRTSCPHITLHHHLTSEPPQQGLPTVLDPQPAEWCLLTIIHQASSQSFHLSWIQDAVRVVQLAGLVGQCVVSVESLSTFQFLWKHPCIVLSVHCDLPHDSDDIVFWVTKIICLCRSHQNSTGVRKHRVNSQFIEVL